MDRESSKKAASCHVLNFSWLIKVVVGDGRGIEYKSNWENEMEYAILICGPVP